MLQGQLLCLPFMYRKPQKKHSNNLTNGIVKGTLALVTFIITKGDTSSNEHVLITLGWMNMVWFHQGRVLISISDSSKVKVYLHSFIHLHGTVLDQAQNTFTFRPNFHTCYTSLYICQLSWCSYYKLTVWLLADVLKCSDIFDNHTTNFCKITFLVFPPKHYKS